VRRLAPSFGAVNLEDISQPNCFRVLDALRESCDIPVWHDDAQGTGCVTLAGLLNALKVAGKDLGRCRIVFNGAGASNTTIARLILQAGADPARVAMFDSRGGLHAGRADIEADARFYRKWEICQATNPGRIGDVAEALKGADVLISLSRPGPGRDPARVGARHGEERHRLCLRESGAGDLSARREGRRGAGGGDGARRFPEPGQQFAGVPRHPEGRAAGAREEDHRRHGDCRARRRSRASRSARGLRRTTSCRG
jgi:hypothetical protein